ncbi:hypothetical protein BX600DRAFT_101825 [Xylariales sp. PMI_506]|nr:hypothetical protein BX600DRAFT_101825 [Xylariales sp. PMI_506]
MDVSAPQLDFDHDEKWWWPAWKVGLRCEDLSTTLFEQYNTRTSPIQDMEAFHHDVLAIATEADSPDDFHQRMVARKQQRAQELSQAWKDVALQLTTQGSALSDESWEMFVQLCRTMSFDSQVRFAAGFLLPQDVTKPSNTIAEASAQKTARRKSRTASRITKHVATRQMRERKATRDRGLRDERVNDSVIIFEDSNDEDFLHTDSGFDEGLIREKAPLSPASTKEMSVTSFSTSSRSDTEDSLSNMDSIGLRRRRTRSKDEIQRQEKPRGRASPRKKEPHRQVKSGRVSKSTVQPATSSRYSLRSSRKSTTTA